MQKIIIETDLDVDLATRYVLKVIEKGKISKTSKGDQYCFSTIWDSGVIVESFKNKNSDRFIVYERK
jgi:hypothetical protein